MHRGEGEENPWTWEHKPQETHSSSTSSDSTQYGRSEEYATPATASAQPHSAYAPNQQTVFNQQPGIIPLRPLSISDLLEGSFGAIRANPGVMFGFAMAVMGAVAVISGIITAYSPLTNIMTSLQDPDEIERIAQTGITETFASSLAGILGTAFLTWGLQYIAILFVTGLLTYTVSRAVIGKIAPLNTSWSQSKGRIPALIGVAILTSLISSAAVAVFISLYVLLVAIVSSSTPGVGSVSALIAFTFLIIFAALAVVMFLTVKLLLAPVAVVLESAGPITALKRSWSLTKGFFWSTLGRVLLIQILLLTISQIFTFILAIPASAMLSEAANMIFGVVLGILVSGLVLPLQAAYTTLVYIDLRMRKENLGQALLEESLR